MPMQLSSIGLLQTTLRMIRLLSALIAVGLSVGCQLPAAGQSSDVTKIEITGKVLVEDTARLGINLGDDAYYSGAALVKKRTQENFEGTSYRQCHFGPLQDENGATTWFDDWGDWDDQLLPGAKFTILSGPAKGISGKIKEVSVKKVRHEGEMNDFRYFVFDRRVPHGDENVGVMVETFRLDDGQFRSLDGYWTSEENRIATDDPRPGSFGTAALALDGRNAAAHVRFATHYQRFGETNGRWQVHFWAKAASPGAGLTVHCDPEEYGESKAVDLSDEWKKYELTLVADAVPEPSSPDDDPMLRFRFDVERGEVIVDDIEIWMEGDRNPSVFRDDCVETLELFKPGILRRLQMGGSTVENTISPILASHSYNSQSDTKVGPYEEHLRDAYSLDEMYKLCEQLECEPWYCLPGTLNADEITRFMEYLGAPADVGYGRRRAELGHPRPWTEVFSRIHVEFGNEAWNSSGPYQCGGFNGPDYWKGLIARAKSSPYYKRSIVFHAGGQADNSWTNVSLLSGFPNADRFSLAPYILQDFSKAESDSLDTDDKFFRWAFAYPFWRSLNSDGPMYQNYKAAREAGIELSVYEINHHITSGDGPLEPRNRLVTSIGGGLNVANTMLLLIKENHARDQCLFSLIQHSYDAHNVGPVRLWGTALSMRKGQRRYRPTFLACAAANRAIGGDLVETLHSGANPTFSATGVFRWGQGPEKVKDLPEISSYGFVDGQRRGLILINLSTSKAHAVSVSFAGQTVPGSAKSWILAADSITANNEFESAEAQVELREQPLDSFQSGWQDRLPPFSMRVLTWSSVGG